MRTIKKTVSFLVVLCLMFTSIMLQNVYAENDYPSKYQNTRTDKWNFDARRCTSFVAWRLNSRNKIDFNNNYKGKNWDDPRAWGENAKELGILVDKNPAIGAVAWWDTGRIPGHVAWVSAVDGETVTVEEYNWKIFFGYDEGTIDADNPAGYIHFKDLSSANPAPDQGKPEQTDNVQEKPNKADTDEGKQNQVKPNQGKQKQSNSDKDKQDDSENDELEQVKKELQDLQNLMDKQDEADTGQDVTNNSVAADAGHILPNTKKSGLKFNVIITEKDMQKAVDEIEELDRSQVIVNLAGNVLRKFKKITIMMTKDALDVLTDNEVESFGIYLPENEIYFDDDALEEISDKSGDGNIVFTIKKTKPKAKGSEKKDWHKDACTLDIKTGNTKIKKLSEGKIEVSNEITNLNKKDLNEHLLWFLRYKVIIN